MSAIDELLAMTDEEEVWELDTRYVVNELYVDDDGPVEVNNKSIGDMSSQISIQGESLSQYIEFVMSRYYDNIDLSEKVLSIHYRLGERVGDNAPVNVYKSQDRIKFGWLIPANATADEGKLAISIWARSFTDTEEYIWKSRTTHYTIERGMTIGEGITEPDENWYLDFVRQMDTKVSEALLYSSRAKQSANEASESAQSASVSKQEASNSATTAIQKAGEALVSASQASNSATTAISNAELSETYRDGAKDYYERTKGISEGLSGQLVPMGTVTFENLPALEDVAAGWMYNISNEFTTTSQFKEGAGKVIPLGSNVYKTTDGYWDVLAGSPVSGVKGSAEATYRSGNVNITPANLGITVVNNTKDENKNVNHSKTSDSTTKAAQDSNGNVIVDTYASKSEASLSGTATGTNPTITDSTDAPIIYLKSNGYTEQFTTTGKNLLNYDEWKKVGCTRGTAIFENNGVTITAIEEDAFTMYGTGYFSEEALIPVSVGEQYTISWEESSNTFGMIYIFNQNGNSLFNKNNNSGKSLTFTIPESTTHIQFRFGVKNVGTTISYKNIQIEKGSVATPYEPYTGGIASPNPDYPQEINGLAKDGAIEVKTFGKNVFSATLEDYQNNGTISGVGTKLYFKLKPNTVYTCSSNVSKYNDAGDTNIWFNGGSSYPHGVYLDNPKTTTTDNDGMLYVDLRTSNLEDLFNNYWIQIEEGDTATPYEPYTETTTNIPTDAPLYEGDYLEVYADGSGKLVRAMAEVVLDGSDDEEWRKSVEGTIYYTILNDAKYSGGDNNVNNVQGLCSHFTMLDSYYNAIIKGYGYCGFGIVSSLSKTTVGMNSSLTTVNEWKTWLQSNPVTVVYELAEPTETPLTAEQVAEFKKLYTFEPITNVLCDGEVEMIYFKNNPNGRVAGMLQRQIDSITSALSAEVEES